MVILGLKTIWKYGFVPESLTHANKIKRTMITLVNKIKRTMEHIYMASWAQTQIKFMLVGGIFWRFDGWYGAVQGIFSMDE